jgi:hypothetical protein
MNHFRLSEAAVPGRMILSSESGLEYDRKIVRDVYLGEPLDVGMLPAFCTDSQRHCDPFPRAASGRR